MLSVILSGVYHIGFYKSRHIVIAKFWRGQLQTWEQVFYQSTGQNSKKRGTWFPMLCIEKDGHFVKGIVVPPHKRRKNENVYKAVKTYLPSFSSDKNVIQPHHYIKNYDHSSIEHRCLYREYIQTSAILSELIRPEIQEDLRRNMLFSEVYSLHGSQINTRINGFYEGLNGNECFMYPSISQVDAYLS